MESTEVKFISFLILIMTNMESIEVSPTTRSISSTEIRSPLNENDDGKPSLKSNFTCETHNGLISVGDMVMDETQCNYFLLGDRKAFKPDNYRWPKEEGVPTLPYIINGRGEKFINVINRGISYWEKETCIRFRPKTEKDASYLEFTIGDGCWSFIGHVKHSGSQTLSLGANCHTFEIVTHEIGHAIGFLHEHSRPDRDDFVRVVQGNIKEGKETQFVKTSWDFVKTFGVQYDYTSIMHYKANSFSKNGRFTLRTLEPSKQGLIRRVNGLSHRDKVTANLMYGCLVMWRDKCEISENICENEGYIGPDCHCICPPGTEGDTCHKVLRDYYGNIMSRCNKNITKNNTIIRTPNYPSYVPPDSWCVYQIKAPVNYWIKIIFDEELYLKCSSAYLVFFEVNTKGVITSDAITCGEVATQGDVYVSSTNDLILYLDVNKENIKTKGFILSVSFTNQEDTSSTTISFINQADSTVSKSYMIVTLFILSTLSI